MQKIIVVSGLPGCGKSTISEALAKHLRLPIFSVDPIESAVIRSGIKRSYETGLSAYIVAETLAMEHLKLGQSIILDSVSGPVEAKDMWRKLAKNFKARLIIIECFCSDIETQHSRIKNRKRDIVGIPEISRDGIEEYKSNYVDWDEPRLKIDACKDKNENIKEAIEYTGR